jgi:hypothetical protein
MASKADSWTRFSIPDLLFKKADFFQKYNPDFCGFLKVTKIRINFHDFQNFIKNQGYLFGKNLQTIRKNFEKSIF